MDRVLAQLLEIIADEARRPSGPGEVRLPSERELAARLRVQRPILRERLSVLEHFGAIRRTQGSGTYVRAPSADVFAWYFDLSLTLGYVSVDEVHAARTLLERENVRRAAEVASAEDVAELERLRQAMSAPGSTPEQQLAADHEFHRRLAHAARNPVMTLVFEGLARLLRVALDRRRRMVRTSPGAQRTMDRLHGAIVDALRARDPERAVRAMEEHFSVHDDLMARAANQLVSVPPPREGAARPRRAAARRTGARRPSRRSAPRGPR
jgi:DNA-binding FadR family transcriptional regulator